MNPRPKHQHELRSARTDARVPRAANNTEHQARLASRLTTRDRWLAAMVHEHRVLTSDQLAALAFPSGRAARARLRQLFCWSVLDRFQPLLAYGSAPMHYVLGPAGATVLAHQHGLSPQDLGYQRDRALGISHSLRLAHTVACNDLLVTLAAHTRRRPHEQLACWWSEHRCARHVGDLARPDAYARWHTPTGQLAFYLEYDTGTEPLTRLAAKLPGYHDLARSAAATIPVLFWLPSLDREAHARRTLHHAQRGLDRPALVPLATASPEPACDPAGPVWLPIDDPRGDRRPLTALAAHWPDLATAADLDSMPAPAGRGTGLPAPVPQAPGSLPPRRR